MEKISVAVVCLLAIIGTWQCYGQSTAPGETSAPEVGPGEVRAMFLQESGVPSSKSFGRIVTPFPELRDFTVCYRIRLQRFREESTLMSYAISDGKDNELRMDHRMSGYKVSLHSVWAKTKIDTPLRYWSHFCFLYNHGSGDWSIFMNGVLRANGSLPMTSEPLEGNGAYIIGQEQDQMGGGFQRDQSYSGEIAQLNFWSSVLDANTIRKIAECIQLEEGDALPWSTQIWNINGEVKWMVYKEEELCPRGTRTLAVIPDRFALKPALHLCRILGGILAVPQTAEENAWVYDVSKERAPYCSGNVGASYLWLGANDQQEEGVWRYWESTEVLPWQSKWRGDGPNGGTVENCMVMLSGSFPARWSDMACLETYEFCVPCEFNKLEVLYLKGPAVCTGSPFNLYYFIGAEKGGRPSFVGFLHSDIFWDVERKAWVMQSLKEEGIAWWKPPEEGMYPFGKQPWTLESKVCEMRPGQSINMTLSACGNGQFTCADGSCIDLTNRCDLRVDCPDESDEAQCSLINIPPGYRTSIPPPPISVNESLSLVFSVNIISFPSIQTEKLTYVTSLQLRLRWKDVRLTYLNLKSDRSLNVLPIESVSKIWTPRVFFSNAQGNVFTNLGEGSRVECVRLGESTAGQPHLPEEVNTFSGMENSMEMSQLYSVKYTCDFDLVMFPFDAQVCHLRFTLVSATTTYMKLVAGNATYSGPSELIEYAIGQVTTKISTEGEFSSIDVEVRFRRRYGFYILTLYIPTSLLVLIAYATFFFNPLDFNSRIVVALTSLLVLSSLFTQTSNSLPKTSYFKLIDIWLFFSIFIIFVMTMLQTLIDFSAPPEGKKESFFARMKRKILNKDVPVFPDDNIMTVESDDKPHAWETIEEPQKITSTVKTEIVNMRMMYISRILIPFIFGIFNILYWGTAVRQLNSLGEEFQVQGK